MSTTVSRISTARARKHHTDPSDGLLERRQLEQDFRNIYLKTDPSEVKREWTGDLEPSNWTSQSKLFFREIHPTEKVSFGLDLGTRKKLEGAEWDAWIERNDKLRARYRRPDGTGWRATNQGQLHATLSIRPDHAMTLTLAGDKRENLVFLSRLGVEVAQHFNATVTSGPRVGGIECHFANSIPHYHPYIWTVNESGELLWTTKGSGRKGLNLLGPGKLAIMRLVAAGIMEGDPYAERCFANRCRAHTHRAADGLPPDWSCSMFIDRKVQAYIDSKPEMAELGKRVTADYKLWVASKMKASPFNHRQVIEDLRAENQALRDKVDALSAQVRDLVEMLRKGAVPPAPAPVAPAPTAERTARDTLKAVFCSGDPLGRWGWDPRNPTSAEVFRYNYHTCVGDGAWQHPEPAPTLEELTAVRERVLAKPHEAQIEALYAEVDAWVAGHPATKLQEVSEVDEFEEAMAALAKPKEESKKAVPEAPKVEPEPEPFFAPVEAIKPKKEEEEEDEVKKQLASLGWEF